MKFRCTLCACCLAAALLPHAVTAQNYTFTNIADTTGPYSSFFAGGEGGPRLNNSGAVSFSAFLDNGGSGVYRSDGVVTTTIADETGPLQNFVYSDINDSGQVAYRAVSSALGPGNFRGDGLSTTTIIWERELPFTNNGDRFLFGPITINNPGTVAFLAHGAANLVIEAAAFVGNGGNITFVSDPTDYRANSTQINNLGTVAFNYQLFGAAGSGIGLGTGGTTSTVIDHTGPYSDFQTPGFNDNNVVAVAAKRDAGGWDVLRINGATVSVVAGPFNENPAFPTDPAGVRDVGLNNAGDVAFLAHLAPNMYGILTGPNPIADKVIGDGDALFGSTVTLLKSSGASTIDGPNDAGQIVFRYSLANGRSGIALATPVAGLAGDYNGNDSVDAADYILWRDNVQPLPNNEVVTVGTTEHGDYTAWRARFGNAGSGSGAATNGVPEPGTFMLVCAAVALLWGTAIKRLV